MEPGGRWPQGVGHPVTRASRALARPALALLLLLVSAGCAARGLDPAASAADEAAYRDTLARSARLWQRAESLRAQDQAASVELFELDEVAAAASPTRPLLKKRRRVLRAEAVARRTEAIVAYRALVDAPDLRDAPERSRALFALAHSLQDAGKAEEARNRYRQLLEEHPEAKATPEAYLELANLAYAEGDLDEAVWRCDGSLRRSTKPSLRKRALYLKAWSLKGLGRKHHRAAMEALRELVRMRPSDPRSLEAQLEDAAASELVTLYTDHGDPDEAASFFAAAGPRGAKLLQEARARGLGTGRRLERLERKIY
ncbi:tetratricopeptide repeat protein [Chondromyces crocatus]|uniref:tetratricopeptide repeat protein n=1 Tax=Chondromyces crocatus TaxID=52 RepID=UPI00147041CE|nr:tetratricopeptide repeat protein [Chondromyces crocatus]